MDAARPHPTPTTRAGFEAVVRDPCHVRHFRDDAVPREDVEHMVDLAMCAASTCSAQAWRFLAVQDQGLIAAMRAAVLERFEELALTPGLALQEHKRTAARAQALLFAKAPLCIAVLALPSGSPIEELMELAGMTQEEHDRLCVRPELQSAGAAVQLLTTSAHSLGYAACWTCAPIVAGERLERLLQVEAPARLVALVAIGRPAEQPTSTRRLPLERALSFR
ncbi:MAG TPA: nitroreductase family protein [Thermoleophilia bacterium]|nr:nitroreductase family protein [Thermoleophilia bacterium]